MWLLSIVQNEKSSVFQCPCPCTCSREKSKSKSKQKTIHRSIKMYSKVMNEKRDFWAGKPNRINHSKSDYIHISILMVDEIHFQFRMRTHNVNQYSWNLVSIDRLYLFWYCSYVNFLMHWQQICVWNESNTHLVLLDLKWYRFFWHSFNIFLVVWIY